MPSHRLGECIIPLLVNHVHSRSQELTLLHALCRVTAEFISAEVLMLARAEEEAEMLSYMMPYLSGCGRYIADTARTCILLVSHILIDELAGVQRQVIDGENSLWGWNRCWCRGCRWGWHGNLTHPGVFFSSILAICCAFSEPRCKRSVGVREVLPLR